MLCNSSYSFCLDDNCDLWCLGYHKISGNREKQGRFYNQIKNIFSSLPPPITQLSNSCNIKMVNMNSVCLFILDKDNKVYKIALVDEFNFSKTNLFNIEPISYISCARNCALFLTTDGLVYSFGTGNKGELGFNERKLQTPQQIPNINNIEVISCGGYHVICKSYDNKYYGWGDNSFGQFGQGNYDVLVKKSLECNLWPNNIINIKCGDYFTLLLTNDGDIYSFGLNSNGCLGINEIMNVSNNTPTLIKDIGPIYKIECGYYHSICVDYDNNIWVFGDNRYGQLGLGNNHYAIIPILHPILSNIIDISAGGFHTFVKTIDTKIYAFGNNNYSQLGIKTSEEDQVTPIQVLQGQEDIWCSTIGKSRQKSARK